MPASRNALIDSLEKERKKFEQDDYLPTQRLLQQCRACCQLLKSEFSSLNEKPRQTRDRKLNARHNLVLILEKSAEIFILRCINAPITKIGSKREYGLVPKLMSWWVSVPHPQNLRSIAQDICREFDLQYPINEGKGPCIIDSTSIERGHNKDTTDSYGSVTEPRAADEQPLQESGDRDLNDTPVDYTTEILLAQAGRETFDIARSFGNCKKLTTGDQLQLNSRKSTSNIASQSTEVLLYAMAITITYSQCADINQIPRPEDQPLRSVLPFQKPELLSFLSSPYNLWETGTLASFLPAACSDLRMVMPWSGTPLPTIEIKLELPIEFSEALMKFRQSRLNDGSIVQKDGHKIGNSGQALGQ